MRYTFTGKNIVVFEAVKERTEHKINKLAKLLPEDAEVYVAYSVTKLDNKIEVTIPLHKRVLRAEVVSDDMFSAIDEIVDVLEKQMIKYKTRLKNKSRKDAAYKEEFVRAFPAMEEEAIQSENEIQIKKTKKFALKPMDPEEAVMEMELLGHNFYVFRDGMSDDVSVVYKRANGTYGLIEPEY